LQLQKQELQDKLAENEKAIDELARLTKEMKEKYHSQHQETQRIQVQIENNKFRLSELEKTVTRDFVLPAEQEHLREHL